MEDRRACEVLDGRFVVPCSTLESMVENPVAAFSRAKGITRWHYTNIETRQPSRTFYGIKSKEHKDGMLFNFCPWCGTKIDAPFVRDEDEEVPA